MTRRKKLATNIFAIFLYFCYENLVIIFEENWEELHLSAKVSRWGHIGGKGKGVLTFPEFK